MEIGKKRLVSEKLEKQKTVSYVHIYLFFFWFFEINLNYPSPLMSRPHMQL